MKLSNKNNGEKEKEAIKQAIPKFYILKSHRYVKALESHYLFNESKIRYQ